MGRSYRTRSTVEEVMRIELRYLQEAGYIQKGAVIKSSLRWNNGATVGIVSTYLEDEISLELFYRVRGIDQFYKIYLEATPSNLGKGKILYLLCPKTGRRCRILYLAYGSSMFLSRGAYSYRLYYGLQTSSQQQRDNNRYFHIEGRLERLYQMRGTYKYKGKLTKRAQLIQKLEDKRDEADYKRFSTLLGWVTKRG